MALGYRWFGLGSAPRRRIFLPDAALREGLMRTDCLI
jgi:hypothetical protein